MKCRRTNARASARAVDRVSLVSSLPLGLPGLVKWRRTRRDLLFVLEAILYLPSRLFQPGLWCHHGLFLPARPVRAALRRSIRAPRRDDRLVFAASLLSIVGRPRKRARPRARARVSSTSTPSSRRGPISSSTRDPDGGAGARRDESCPGRGDLLLYRGGDQQRAGRHCG